MAQIYSYPVASPLTTDHVLGSRTDNTSGEVFTYNFSVADIRSGTATGVTVGTPAITTAQLNNIDTTSIKLVDSPGIGNVINVLDIVVYVNSPTGGTVFTYNNDLLIKIGTAVVATIPKAVINTAVGTSVVQKLTVSGGALVTNQLEITSAAQPTARTGTATMGISIRYEILNTGVSF